MAQARTDVPAQKGERNRTPERRWRDWLLEGLAEQSTRHPGPHGTVSSEQHRRPWWRVMCLTGVDYFSTLGYQPGIAALAAGLLSPLATLVLIALTLFGALPVYRRVAADSPRGEGSIAMLERLLPWWAGKLMVLVLLGFAATDFIITITMSAADATAHMVHNPLAPEWARGSKVWITLVMVGALGAVFLKGFREAIGIAVALVAVFLSLNLVVLVTAASHVAATPVVMKDWWTAATTQHTSALGMIGVALLVFPRLALGMSGFETGVAVMPQVHGDASDTEAHPAGRIRNTRHMLTTAALIMSGFLLLSSLASTLLIPAHEFQPGGQANGRALAYLAHRYLGGAFGTVYDVSTIAILWFAGASALAGLLNLVPRYLPRYGMAPDWARAVRPLVLVFVAIAVIITVMFRADVDAQGGAYATGVLVLMLTGAFAVTIAARARGQRIATVGFGLITAVFGYTLATNVVERPDGIKIASMFILGILITSFASRVRRSFELRSTRVTFDATATTLIDRAVAAGPLRIIAHEPQRRDAAEYRDKRNGFREETATSAADDRLFLEVTVSDSSDFTTDLEVTGEKRYGNAVLSVRGPVVANTIAAVLMSMRDRTGQIPHAYFNWTEGHPLGHLLRFLVFGDGEVAPVTREVLRRAEPDPEQRPRIHAS